MQITIPSHLTNSSGAVVRQTRREKQFTEIGRFLRAGRAQVSSAHFHPLQPLELRSLATSILALMSFGR